MRVEVFLQSAAIKILQQKLSGVSFPAEMVQVLFTSVFYLLMLMLLILGVMAFLVRLYLYGATWNLEPDTRTLPKPEKFLLPLKDTPENISIEDEASQKQSSPEINSGLHDKLNTCLVPLAERSNETKAGPGVPEQQPPSKPKVAPKAVLSPLTLFLLGTDTLHTYDPVYEKKLQGKRKRWLNKALRLRRKPYVCFK